MDGGFGRTGGRDDLAATAVCNDDPELLLSSSFADMLRYKFQQLSIMNSYSLLLFYLLQQTIDQTTSRNLSRLH
jgi:hypothetical protein